MSRPPSGVRASPMEEEKEESAMSSVESSAYVVVLRFLRGGRAEVRVARGGVKGLARVEEMAAEFSAVCLGRWARADDTETVVVVAAGGDRAIARAGGW